MRWWIIGGLLGLFVGCLLAPSAAVRAASACVERKQCKDAACRLAAAEVCAREHVSKACARAAKERCSAKDCMGMAVDDCAQDADICIKSGLDPVACQQEAQQCAFEAGQKCSDERSACLTPAIRECFDQEDAVIEGLR